MKFKLDECLDVRLSVFFADAGHDIQTVYEQALAGKPDGKIYSVCIEEGRTLITQDMDFSSPFRFSPLPSQGIIVLKNPSQLLSEAKYLIRTLRKSKQSFRMDISGLLTVMEFESGLRSKARCPCRTSVTYQHSSTA